MKIKKLNLGAIALVVGLASANTAYAAQALKGDEAKAAITCHQYFQRYVSKFKASFHKIEVKKVNDVYQLHWTPENFKIKNAYGQWVKNHAFCELAYGSNGKYQDLKLLKVGSVTLVNTYK